MWTAWSPWRAGGTDRQGTVKTEGPPLVCLRRCCASPCRYPPPVSWYTSQAYGSVPCYARADTRQGFRGASSPLCQDARWGVYMPRLVTVGHGQTHMVLLTTPHESTATRRRLNKKAQKKTNEQRAFSAAVSLGRKESDDMRPTASELATQRSVAPVLPPPAMPRTPVLCRQDTLDRSKCLHLGRRLVCDKAYTGLPLCAPYSGEATVGCERYEYWKPALPQNFGHHFAGDFGQYARVTRRFIVRAGFFQVAPATDTVVLTICLNNSQRNLLTSPIVPPPIIELCC